MEILIIVLIVAAITGLFGIVPGLLLGYYFYKRQRHHAQERSTEPQMRNIEETIDTKDIKVIAESEVDIIDDLKPVGISVKEDSLSIISSSSKKQGPDYDHTEPSDYPGSYDVQMSETDTSGRESELKNGDGFESDYEKDIIDCLKLSQKLRSNPNLNFGDAEFHTKFYADKQSKKNLDCSLLSSNSSIDAMFVQSDLDFVDCRDTIKK